jgi:hypothetical protein
MSSLIKMGIKDKSGKYKNYIISIQDELDQYGNNVSMYLEQTKEERLAKAKRTYVGNGRVIWTSDGKIEVAPNPNEVNKSEPVANVAPSPEGPTVLDELKTSEPETVNNETEDDLPF